MTAVDIHPEDLIDKLAAGSLTATERYRLSAHLAQCSSCRFEIAVRVDLAGDAPEFEERPQLGFASGGRLDHFAGARRDQSSLGASLSVRVRARRRWPLLLLAAAVVLCAGGAMAAVFSGADGGRWLRWSREPKPAESSGRLASAKPAPKAKRVLSEPRPSLAPAMEPVAGRAPADAPAAPQASATATSSPAVVPLRAALVEPRRAKISSPPLGDARSTSVGVYAAERDPSRPTEALATGAEAAALFADANRARRDGNAERAVSLYRALQSRYPSSSESELSRALLAQLLLDRGSPEAALAGFDRYLAEGTPVLVAEALVGRARALEQLGKSAQAAAAWQDVQSRFPGSVHARLAATRLAALGTR